MPKSLLMNRIRVYLYFYFLVDILLNKGKNFWVNNLSEKNLNLTLINVFTEVFDLEKYMFNRL